MLVKLPKEVGKLMSRLEEKGFDVYVVGGCVRDSVLGRKPYDWDLTTNAGIDDLKTIFPEAKVLSTKYSVIRLEYIEEVVGKDGGAEETGLIIDIASYRKEGEYVDGRPKEVFMAESIEEDLERRDFTINAIADGTKGYVDKFEGREDLRKRLIRSVGDADKKFKEDPVRMLRAIRLAAQLDFDLHKSVHDAILRNYRLLYNASVDKIRDEFTLLISAENAGKGLSMLMDTGIIDIIVGEKTVAHLSRREMSDLTDLTKNINKTKRVEERRLGLFFCCIGEKPAKVAIEKLNFEEPTRTYLLDAIKDMAKLYFIGTGAELKKFIYVHGWDRYEYLANLEKAQRIVFDYFSETKIRSKMYLLDEIKNNGEPIFVEDLAIDGNDLLENNICKKEDVDKVLHMVVEDLHVKPKKHTREDELLLAKRFAKSKLMASLRGISWLR